MPEIFRSAESNREFDHLYRKGFFKKILGSLKNHKNRLLPLNQIKEIIGTGEEHHLGVKTVEIDKIIGSENRFEDFDRAFLPLNKFNRRKWTNIRSYYEQHESLPVISLYKIGDYYFIRDGHNRVSVAKNAGQLYIDAEVIEINIPNVHFNSSSPDNYFLKLEEKMFREKTGLQNIQITLPGGYREILKLIQCLTVQTTKLLEINAKIKYLGKLPFNNGIRIVILQLLKKSKKVELWTNLKNELLQTFTYGFSLMLKPYGRQLASYLAGLITK